MDPLRIPIALPGRGPGSARVLLPFVDCSLSLLPVDGLLRLGRGDEVALQTSADDVFVESVGGLEVGQAEEGPARRMAPGGRSTSSSCSSGVERIARIQRDAGGVVAAESTAATSIDRTIAITIIIPTTDGRRAALLLPEAGRGDGPDPDAGVAQLAARDEAGPRDVPQVHPRWGAVLALPRFAPDGGGQERRAVVEGVGHLRQFVLGHGLGFVPSQVGGES